MKAFMKTLFGDWLNLGFIAIVVAVEVVLVRSGYVLQASVIVPLFIMGGVGLLATR